MTLQRRVLLQLLVIAPVVWLCAITVAWLTTRYEVDELFDTQQVKLARQVMSMLKDPETGGSGRSVPGGEMRRQAGNGLGKADPGDLAIAAWTLDGRLLTVPDLQVDLPFASDVNGFITRRIGRTQWRIYYFVDAGAGRVVSVGVNAKERSDILRNLMLSHLVPWLLSLPVLLVAISTVLRRELHPLRALAADLTSRRSDDLHPVESLRVPSDIAPVITALNALFGRIDTALEHERRLTADAAHELRSPIAALQAQWDALALSRSDADRARATSNISASIARLSRLVGQLLSLSAVEADSLRRTFVAVDWHRVIGDAIGDVLALIEERHADVAVEWPDEGVAPMPLQGDESLLGTMLRNLLDNGIRHSPVGAKLLVRVTRDSLSVIDDGPGLAPGVASRLGKRFVRASGQPGAGSGIGISIVLRIASLHGLAVAFVPAGAKGLEVVISRGAR